MIFYLEYNFWTKLYILRPRRLDLVNRIETFFNKKEDLKTLIKKADNVAIGLALAVGAAGAFHMSTQYYKQKIEN